MMPPLIPAFSTGEVRRRVPKISKNQRVPLWTVEPDGQLFQGIIRVPARLCNAPEHSNTQHEFDNLIKANLARWVEWRGRRGWHISENPRVSAPFDPPEGDRLKAKARIEHVTKRIGKPREVGAITEYDYPEEFKWYMAEARFTREERVFVCLEDMLFLRHLALTYGVDPDRDPLPYNVLPEGKDYLEVEGGLDPIAVAEERRQSMGLKREDYLFGPLGKPL